jgi:hypothetical protein
VLGYRWVVAVGSRNNHHLEDHLGGPEDHPEDHLEDRQDPLEGHLGDHLDTSHLGTSHRNNHRIPAVANLQGYHLQEAEQLAAEAVEAAEEAAEAAVEAAEAVVAPKAAVEVPEADCRSAAEPVVRLVARPEFGCVLELEFADMRSTEDSTMIRSSTEAIVTFVAKTTEVVGSRR